MKIRRSSKPCVEELENRIVPATVVPPPVPPSPYALWPSSNWSGITLDTSTLYSATAVSGSWAVPTVTGPSGKGSLYSATWVGIDGDASSTVEQTGTSSNWINGAPQYYAWFEMYPAYPYDILTATSTTTHKSVTATVKPGDNITASVNWVSTTGSGRRAEDSYKLSITDATEGWTYTTTQNLPSHIIGARNSVEWIEEAPSSNSGVLALANFGSVTFTNTSATISSTTGNIGNFAGSSLIYNYGNSSTGWEGINLVDMGAASYQPVNSTTTWSVVNDETSVLNAAGNSFTVVFGDANALPPLNAAKNGIRHEANQRMATLDATGLQTNDSAVAMVLAPPAIALTSAAPNGTATTSTLFVAPPAVLGTTTPTASHAAFQSVASGFGNESLAGTQTGPGATPAPFDDADPLLNFTWRSDLMLVPQGQAMAPAAGLLGDSEAALTLPDPGRTLSPEGPTASNAELDALFSNWQPAVGAPLASAGPRLDGTDMVLATLAVSGLVVWSEKRREAAEGKEPALRGR